MNQCVSCKNINSAERCPLKSLTGIPFCGKHAKMKKHKLWVEPEHLSVNAIKIQKLWRGYSVRHYLELAGKGVLKRSLCHNEEEVNSLEDKHRQHPFEYFSFEESGKLWWLDVRSMYEWSVQQTKPSNPYTRQDLSREDCARFRELLVLRKIRKWSNEHNLEKDFPSKFSDKWMRICQEIEEKTFTEINPIFFGTMSRNTMYVFTRMILQDVTAWRNEKPHGPKSRRAKYVYWLWNCAKKQVTNVNTPIQNSYFLAGTLLNILMDCKESYPVCFIILSALYRL